MLGLSKKFTPNSKVPARGLTIILSVLFFIFMLSFSTNLQAAVTPVPHSGYIEGAGEGFGTFDALEPVIGQPEITEEYSDELPAILTGIFHQQLEQEDVPGLVAVAVQDGEVIYKAGLGYADIEAGEKFEPEKHAVRTGSVGKLFTWLAILQQVEEGNLELDRDINQYLPEDKRFNPPGNNYITLENILTHSAGFEDSLVGLLVENEEDIKDLSEYIKSSSPALVRPPGEVSSYSNFGSTLAGYLLELASEEDYSTYLEDNIFSPLEMLDSTAKQALSEEDLAEMSTGYDWQRGEFIRGEFEYFQEYPAGGHTTTAADMANLLGYLTADRAEFNGEEEILSPSYQEKLFEIIFQQHPESAGFSHGLMEYKLFGEELFWHGGDTQYFHSGLFLWPEENLGIFVSYNGPGGTLARQELIKALGKSYYGLDYERPAAAEVDLEQYEGNYFSTRRSHTTPEKVAAVLNQVEIRESNDMLNASFFKEQSYYPVAEDVFISQTGGEHLYFTRDEEGKIEYMYAENNPVEAFEKQGLLQDYRLHLFILALAIISYLTTPLLNIRKLFKKENKGGLVSRKKISSLTGVLLSLVGLLFLVLLMVVFYQLIQAPYSWPALTGLVGLLPIVMILLAIRMVYQLIRGGFLARNFISQLLLLLITISFLLLLFNYNLIGFGVFF